MANQSYHLLLKMTPPSHHRRRWRIALALILVTVEVVSTAELSYVSNGGTSGFYKECEGTTAARIVVVFCRSVSHIDCRCRTWVVYFALLALALACLL